MVNTTIIKQWVVTNWAIIALVIVSFFLFKSCQGSKELSLVNEIFKKDIELSQTKIASYKKENQVLRIKVDSLEKVKIKIKTQIVEVEKKTENDIKKVSSFTTKMIATYFKDRYKLPVTITQYGVALNDTIGKKNITELVQKDGCFAERIFLKDIIQTSEVQLSTKDTIIDKFKKIGWEQEKINLIQKKLIQNQEDSFKKERNKKTFWQVTTGLAIGVATYSLISK